MAEAGKTKGLYTSVVVRAENLVEQTDTMAPWAWARTQDSVGRLRELVGAVKKQVTPGVSRFVMEEIRTLKTELGEETLLATAKLFNSLKPDLETLSDKVSSVIKAHHTLRGQ